MVNCCVDLGAMSRLVAVIGGVACLLATGAFASAHAPVANAPRGAAAAAAAANGSWTVYHRDNAHTGYDPTAARAGTAAAGWTSPLLTGVVYGEPLVYNGLVYVATLENWVYALDQATGAVVWSKNLGAPQTSGWQCGNIDRDGILGTGVIDTAASRLYVAPFLHQYLSYYLFGLDLATGTTVLSTPVKPAGFDWTIEQQRGALAMSKDGTHVYIPFGGRYGDCGAYHGWVVGVPVSGSPADELYETPSTGEGVWAAGGVLVDDSTGNVFFATGNAMPCSGAINSDSVIRTAGTLGAATSFFQPQDWSSNWCGPDLDLGSASPVLISPSLMFTSGKHGQGFLLNPANLGGTNGQLFPSRSSYTGADVCGGLHSDATFGSFAYAAPYVYLECEGSGFVALHVDTATPAFSLCDATCAQPTWSAGGAMSFGPPIVAGGVVWVADTGGGSGLYGFDASNGTQVFHSDPFGVPHFTTPSEAGGQIFVSAGTAVREFDMKPAGCRAVSVQVNPSSPAAVGTRVTVTAQASGCPNPSPLYHFGIMAPGASGYTLAQDYSTSNTYGWSTSGLVPGTYRFSVWARDASSTGTYGNSAGRWDTYDNNTTFAITTCSTSLTVGTAPGSSSGAGTSVTVTVQSFGCPNPSPLYHFGIMAPGASGYTLAQDYSTSNTYSWSTAGIVPGTYRFSVWVRDASSGGAFGNGAGRWDAYNNGTTYTVTTCSTTLTVGTAPGSPSGVGAPVLLTAQASGCPNPNPLYHFGIMAPGASGYTLLQDYSTSNTYSWSTTGLVPGTYRFSVWVRDASSGGAYGNTAGRWDAYNNGTTFTLTTCSTALDVSVSPSSPAAHGTTVTLTARSAGCPNPNPLYHFAVMAPGASAYTVVQDYSTSNTYTWTTTNLAAGSYRFSVWVRDASSGGAYGYSGGRWDAYNNDTLFTLT